MGTASLGFLADQNAVANPVYANPCTVESNVVWLNAAPLDAIKTTPQIDAAVSSVLGTESDPVTITIRWPYPVDLAYGGLLDTNLWQMSGYRLEAWADPDMAYPVATTRTADGRDSKVVPPLTDPKDMRPGAPNWLRGDLPPADFMLLPTNLHAVVPLCRASVVRWSLWGGAYRPDGTDDTGYRIGLGWAGDGLTFTRRVGGSGEGVKLGDERIETAGGYAWIERGIRRRMAQIDRNVTDRRLKDELFKMALRGGKEKPMIWLPDIHDPANCFLYGGLFRRVDDHAHKYISGRYVSTSIELEECKE